MTRDLSGGALECVSECSDVNMTHDHVDSADLSAIIMCELIGFQKCVSPSDAIRLPTLLGNSNARSMAVE